MLYLLNYKISEKEINIHFVRSSGKGGQNVNKVNTKAVLTWQVVNSHSIPQWVKDLFLKKWGYRISTKGEIVLSSDKHRSQKRNFDEVLKRLESMLEKALVIPKKRIKTKPTKSSIRKKQKEKKIRSEKKRYRKKPSIYDE
jgi:ribosome-associated protein